MRRRTAHLALATALVLSACSAGSDSEGGGDKGQGGTTTTEAANDTTTTVAEPADDPDQAVIDAVDATLAVESFRVESDAQLEVGAQEFRLTSSGFVDYADLLADMEITVTGNDQDAAIALLADGTNLWVRADGGASVEIPDGKTWLEGEATLLEQSDNFAQVDLIGVLVALRAAAGTEVGDTEEIGGVETTSYLATIDYQDAVDAAGDDAEAFQSALSLSSEEPVALDVQVWIGDDGIIRRFHLEVDAGGAPLGGTYEVELSEVGEEPEAPEAPDAADVLSGPEAEELLSQLISS
jgi:hypothetical protein